MAIIDKIITKRKMTNEQFSRKKRLKSFKHAFNGIKVLLKEEHNSRIHVFASIIVIFLGIFLKISNTEWFIIFILIGFIFALELVNSAIENICDLVSPERNDYIKKAKDQGAAAVLIFAIVSAIIGLWIFIPRIMTFVENIN